MEDECPAPLLVTMSCHPRCPLCSGPKLGSWWLHNNSHLYWSILMAIKKEITYLREVAVSTRDGRGAAIAAPSSMASQYPALCEHMTAVAFPSGNERELSTLTIIVEDGRVKACCNDKANRQSIWRSGDSIAAALEALEAAVADDRSEWRRWHSDKPGRKR